MKLNLIKQGTRLHSESQMRSQGGETLVVFSKILDGPKVSSKKMASKNTETLVGINHPGLSQRLQDSVKSKVITGRLSELVTYREMDFEGHRHILVVGLGKEKDLNPESLRKGAATAFEGLQQLAAQEALLNLDSLINEDLEVDDVLRGIVEGFLLASYSFEELKSKKSDKKDLCIHLMTEHASDSQIKKVFQNSVTLSETVNFSRRLGDLPGNLMTPSLLAEETVKASKGTGVKVTVWDKARIKKEKMGGLLGVSQGSSQDPRFIIMEYRGAPKSAKPVVFVGKGLTFDCGGISIKPSAAMEEMKYDMCGGANVIGAVLAIAKLKLKLNVFGLVAATENLAGPSATKPGDVHTARNGKTFEVNNTDAEGRLILADALCYASEMKPQAIVDAATLTGAMVVALGNVHTGFFTRNAGLRERIQSAAETSGELVWNMPLTDEHVKDMKGTFADLSNISSSKGAGSATAAGFLEQFVAEGIPWAHFDIAGTAWAVGNRLNYCPKKGASGIMIRTFVEIAKSFE